MVYVCLIISSSPQAESPPTVCSLFLSIALKFEGISQVLCSGSRFLLLLIQELFKLSFPINGCFLLPDDLPPSQYTHSHSSDSQSDSSQMFQQTASPSKPQVSHRPKDKTNHYPQDVQHYQLQRAVVLGPPGSPQGAKSGSQEQKDDQLKKLERRLEELAHMLDMVKTQVHIALKV